jgi:hypothetical protein
MRQSESFDAFYARTVASVTATMHALAAGDSQADHAIREAYARAYQQWYEVSGYRDPEGWVLDVARQAFERRRAQAVPGGPAQPPETRTWPGMYRQPSPAVAESAAPPQANALWAGPWPADTAQADSGQAGTGRPGPSQAGPSQAGTGQAGAGQADRLQAGPFLADPAYADTADAGRFEARSFLAGPAQAGDAPAGPGYAPGSWPAGRRPADGRTLIAVLAIVAVVLVGGVGFLLFGHKHGPSAAGQRTASRGSARQKQRPHMLAAGQVGARSAVPWSLVGPGWTLAEVSAAASGASGLPTGSSFGTYLIDPEGGRYRILPDWSAGGAPLLLAWSGDADTALYSTGAAGSYVLLDVRTGSLTQLTLPATVAVAGFTRPDGLNLLAILQGPVRYKLQRYNLAGALQGTLSAAGCSAFSSPTGIMVVWGVAGHEMQLVDNAGGLIRRLPVPGSGSPSACTPLGWWNDSQILASCAAAGAQPGATRLWLVPYTGSSPTPVTVPAGSPAGAGELTGAWQADGQLYVTATTSVQCPSAPSGPGGLDIMQLAQGTPSTAITVPGSTGYHNAIVGAVGGRLLVLAQTACPGTSSLLWLNPSTGGTVTLLAAPASEGGVIAAVTYGAY